MGNSMSGGIETNDATALLHHPEVGVEAGDYTKKNEDYVELNVGDLAASKIKFNNSFIKSTNSQTLIIKYQCNFDSLKFLCENLHSIDARKYNDACISFLIMIPQDVPALSDKQQEELRMLCNKRNYEIYFENLYAFIALHRLSVMTTAKKLQFNRTPVELKMDKVNCSIFMSEMYSTSVEIVDMFMKNSRFTMYPTEAISSFSRVTNLKKMDDIMTIADDDGGAVDNKILTATGGNDIGKYFILDNFDVYKIPYSRQLYTYNNKSNLNMNDKYLNIIYSNSLDTILNILNSFSVLKNERNTVILIVHRQAPSAFNVKYIKHYLQNSLDNFTNASYKQHSTGYYISNADFSIDGNLMTIASPLNILLDLSGSLFNTQTDNKVALSLSNKNGAVKILAHTKVHSIENMYNNLSNQNAYKIVHKLAPMKLNRDLQHSTFQIMYCRDASLKDIGHLLHYTLSNESAGIVVVFEKPNIPIGDMNKIQDSNLLVKMAVGTSIIVYHTNTTKIVTIEKKTIDKEESSLAFLTYNHYTDADYSQYRKCIILAANLKSTKESNNSSFESNKCEEYYKGSEYIGNIANGSQLFTNLASKKMTESTYELSSSSSSSNILRDRYLTYFKEQEPKEIFQTHQFDKKLKMNALFVEKNKFFTSIKSVLSDFVDGHLISMIRNYKSKYFQEIQDVIQVDCHNIIFIIMCSEMEVNSIKSSFNNLPSNKYKFNDYKLYKSNQLQFAPNNHIVIIHPDKITFNFENDDNLLKFTQLDTNVMWDYSKNINKIISKRLHDKELGGGGGGDGDAADDDAAAENEGIENYIANVPSNVNIVFPRIPINTHSNPTDTENDAKLMKHVTVSSDELIALCDNEKNKYVSLLSNLNQSTRYNIFNNEIHNHLIFIKKHINVELNYEYQELIKDANSVAFLYIPNMSSSTIRDCINIFVNEMYPRINLSNLMIIFSVWSSERIDKASYVQELESILKNTRYLLKYVTFDSNIFIILHLSSFQITSNDKDNVDDPVMYAKYTNRNGKQHHVLYKLVRDLDNHKTKDIVDDFVMQYVNTSSRIISKISYNHTYTNVKLFNSPDTAQYTCCFTNDEDPIVLYKELNVPTSHIVMLYNLLPQKMVYLLLKSMKTYIHSEQPFTALFTLDDMKIFEKQIYYLEHFNNILNPSSALQQSSRVKVGKSNTTVATSSSSSSYNMANGTWKIFHIPNNNVYCVTNVAQSIANGFGLIKPAVNLTFDSHVPYASGGNDVASINVRMWNNNMYISQSQSTNNIMVNLNEFHTSNIFENFNLNRNVTSNSLVLYTELESDKYKYGNELLYNARYDIQYRDNQNDLKIVFYELRHRQIMSLFSYCNAYSDDNVYIIKVMDQYYNLWTEQFRSYVHYIPNLNIVIIHPQYLSLVNEKINNEILISLKTIRNDAAAASSKSSSNARSAATTAIMPTIQEENVDLINTSYNLKILFTTKPSQAKLFGYSSSKYNMVIALNNTFDPTTYGHKIKNVKELHYAVNSNNDDVIETWTADMESNIHVVDKKYNDFLKATNNGPLIDKAYVVTILFKELWYKKCEAKWKSELSKYKKSKHFLFVFDCDGDKSQRYQKVALHRLILMLFRICKETNNAFTVIFRMNVPYVQNVPNLPDDDIMDAAAVEQRSRIYSDDFMKEYDYTFTRLGEKYCVVWTRSPEKSILKSLQHTDNINEFKLINKTIQFGSKPSSSSQSEVNYIDFEKPTIQYHWEKNLGKSIFKEYLSVPKTGKLYDCRWSINLELFDLNV
uniref:Uncharacterized protein n=1 Tax=Drosophila-associated filamentous virus TaxID=2743186 RepID=A0A6M9U0I9_9VIRU|nr:putative protein 7 [Drosophila-associated filamentous virus]